MNWPQVYICLLHPEAPSHPIPIPSLLVVTESWLWVPCFMHHTRTGYLFLHMVIYMFQCYSLKSSHPLLPLNHF